jgi:hypothetical protein
MPHIERVNSKEEQSRLFEQQDGSDWMIVGFVIFGMGAMLSIYNFSDLRQGTHLMLAYTGILIVVGLALVAVGEYKRSTNA